MAFRLLARLFPTRSGSLRRCAAFAFVAMASAMLVACGGFGQKDETVGWSEEKIYTEAKDYLDNQEWAKAVKYFEILEARYPFGPYSQQAQINIAYANWKDNEIASALAAADRFIQLHPTHPNVDYAYYLKGLINFNDNLGWLGRFTGQDLSERDPAAARSAFESFKVLVTRFPNSKYTPDATARMQYIVNSLAMHEVHVAQHYYLRGAYLAAANRAQSALMQYERAPALEDALIIMIRSYDKMGMADLRDDTRRVLSQTYPNSDFLIAGERRRTKPWWQIW